MQCDVMYQCLEYMYDMLHVTYVKILFPFYWCLQKLEKFHITVTNIAKDLSEREANDALQAYVR